MEINVHHDKKTVDIWLTRAEAADNALRESLKPMYKKYAIWNISLLSLNRERRIC